MDLSPLYRRLLNDTIRIQRTQGHHVACKRKTCWNIVPHRRKNGKGLAEKVGRFNAIALLPQSCYQGPLTCGPFTSRPSCHVAPHTGVCVDPRGPVWPPATCPRPVRHLRLTWDCAALPRGLACRVASVRVPRATLAPHHISYEVCGPKYPLFAILVRKN